MWSRLRSLLHPPNGAIIEHSAYEFAQQITNKVERIRTSIADAPAPVITKRSVSEPLSHFEPLTSEEVIKILLPRRTAPDIW